MAARRRREREEGLRMRGRMVATVRRRRGKKEDLRI
jgi:hypothetical protein